MTEEIEVNGVTLHITPVSELPYPTDMSVGLISQRILHKIDEDDHTVYQDFYEICEVCIDDGIRKETLAGLGVRELDLIFEAIFDDPDEIEDSPEEDTEADRR